ncbi:MAG: hypothetical protein HYU66_07295 [Armatimonadetes bacterium]|nr:hypothetical protein [Armatimonadota bacterium]
MSGLFVALILLAGPPDDDAVTIDPPDWNTARVVPAGTRSTKLFDVVNHGSAPVKVLRIQAQPGLMASLDHWQIPAGGKVRLTLQLQPPPPPPGLTAPYRGGVALVLSAGDPVRLPVSCLVGPPAERPNRELLPAVARAGRYVPHPGEHPVYARLFYNGSCRLCAKFVREVIEPVRQWFADAPVNIVLCDTTDRATVDLLRRLKRQYGIAEVYDSYYLFTGGRVAHGKESVAQHLVPFVTAELRSPTPEPREPTGADTDPLRGLTWLGVLLAGLVDGVNPCALATAVFLVALLTRLGHDRRTLAGAGLAFTAGVYATYFLLGLGVLRSLAFVGRNVKLYQALDLAVAALALGVAALQVRDVLRLRRGAPTRELTMQLPPRAKQRLHAWMREHLSRPAAVLGALTAGCLVTLVEAICTSQMLVPTLAAVMRAPAARAQATALLGLYNLGFVAPLLAVLLLAWRGVTSERMAAWARRHVVSGKLALAVLLAALGAWLLAAPR